MSVRTIDLNFLFESAYNSIVIVTWSTSLHNCVEASVINLSCGIVRNVITERVDFVMVAISVRLPLCGTDLLTYPQYAALKLDNDWCSPHMQMLWWRLNTSDRRRRNNGQHWMVSDGHNSCVNWIAIVNGPHVEHTSVVAMAIVYKS